MDVIFSFFSYFVGLGIYSFIHFIHFCVYFILNLNLIHLKKSTLVNSLFISILFLI